jgi:hypothetical protein
VPARSSVPLPWHGFQNLDESVTEPQVEHAVGPIKHESVHRPVDALNLNHPLADRHQHQGAPPAYRCGRELFDQ